MVTRWMRIEVASTGNPFVVFRVFCHDCRHARNLYNHEEALISRVACR